MFYDNVGICCLNSCIHRCIKNSYSIFVFVFGYHPTANNGTEARKYLPEKTNETILGQQISMSKLEPVTMRLAFGNFEPSNRKRERERDRKQYSYD